MLRWERAAVPFMSILLAAAPACAAERFALVIGNQSYTDKVGPLRNPHNDVALVSKSLTEVGFKLLQPRKDATREQMLKAVVDLAAAVRKAGPGAVSFLYYAGHGLQIGGDNVLVPINADDTSEDAMVVHGVKLNEILDILKGAPNAVHFVVLDSCRNSLRGQRGAQRGFAPVSDQRTGLVIAFATAAGETATDEGESSTPYATALAEEMVKPGQNDQTVFNAVRARVVSATGQVPWTHDGLIGERVIFKPEAKSSQTPSTDTAPAKNEATPAETVRICREIEAMSSLSMLGVLANHHKGTPAGDCIVARINELKHQVVLAAPEKGPCNAVEALVGNQKRCLRPGSGRTEWFRDCPQCPEMVVAPAGSFTMGSPQGEPDRLRDESPERRVTIAAPFAVGRFAVTFEEWDACVAAGGCNSYRPSDQGWGRGPRPGPVINVSWTDAKAYTQWLSKTTGKTYRLLSEAEREYVTRAGTRTAYWWGSSIARSQANYFDNQARSGGSSSETPQRTAPVASFEPNPWGLYQVHGNVWEWAEDCYHGSYQGAPADGSAWTTGDCSRRVLRGGSWFNFPWVLRAAHRFAYSPSARIDTFGFRVARSLRP